MKPGGILNSGYIVWARPQFWLLLFSARWLYGLTGMSDSMSPNAVVAHSNLLLGKPFSDEFRRFYTRDIAPLAILPQ